HAADHLVAIGIAHVLGGGHRFIGQRRRGGATNTRQGVLNQRPPRRVRRRLGEDRAPDRRGVGLAAVLFGGEPEEIVGPRLFGILRDRAFELALGLRRDDAPCRERKRFAELG